MRITRVQVQALVWPHFEKPFWMAISPVNRPAEVVIRLTGDDGTVGIGHTDASGAFRAGARGRLEPGGVALAARDGLAPLALGQNPSDIEGLWERMFALTYRVGWTEPGWARDHILSALAAMDMALWDLKAKVAGKPVWRLLGAKRTRVPCYVAGGYYREGKTVADLARECESYAKQGLKGIKLRVGHVALDEDAWRVKAARNAMGPGIKLMLDGNEAYDLDTAIRAASAFEPHDITWFEEPLRWFMGADGLRRLKERISIPIAAGEQESTHHGALELTERSGLKYQQFDAMRVCGPTEWLRVAKAVAPLGALMAPHHGPHMHAPFVASVPNGAYVETFPDPFTYPFKEGLPLVRWDKKRELFSVYPDVVDGDMVLPDRPGFGIELDERVVKERAIAEFEVGG